MTERKVFARMAANVLRYVGLSTDPVSPVAGDTWYDSLANTPKYYDGAVKTVASNGVLAQSWSDITTTITNANSSAATSGDLGVAVHWDHGYRTVEVRLESFCSINGITQAAGLRVGATMYIADMTLASNGLYVNPYNPLMAAIGTVYHVFHDTTSGSGLQVFNTIVAHVEAPYGTTISLGGRAYQSLASAATWSAVYGYFSPIIMTAREIL